jgi:3-oxoacyl-[acyl-carrier-protein] synthase-3
MKFRFEGVRIAGIQVVLPRRAVAFEDEMANFAFSAEQSLRLKKVMGFGSHRLVDAGTCASDLAVAGLEHLFGSGRVDREAVHALIVVTQSPDFFMPPTSNLIQGRVGLGREVYCLDINQGCAGFVIGLIEAFGLFAQPDVQRVVLVNADVMSRKTSPRDRNSWPLIGDGATITLVERDATSRVIHALCRMDGSRADALMIPAGGFRRPSDAESAVMVQDVNGNFRAADHLVMKGDAVFNFVQTEVPPLIYDTLALSGRSIDSVDRFLFHQPNKFMLQKLADKLATPYEKMPANIVENYGNGSGTSIPQVIWHNLRQDLLVRSMDVCLAGFGVGLTWAAMTMVLGPLAFCDAIEYSR